MAKLLLILFLALTVPGRSLSNGLCGQICDAQHGTTTPETILLKNSERLVPLSDLANNDFSCLLLGDMEVFKNRLLDYLEMPVYTLPLGNLDEGRFQEPQKDLEKRLIVGIDLTQDPEKWKPVIQQFLTHHAAVVVFFGEHEKLTQWEELLKANAIVISARKDSISQDHTAQMLFGALGFQGKLKHEIPGLFSEGHGIETEGGFRFQYTHPESLGLNGRRLNDRIDSIVSHAIQQKAIPGCQILMAVDGKIIHRESYGHHTYDKRTQVHNNDLYDLASVTKITGPLPLLMQLTGNGTLDLDQPFSDYWTDWKNRLFRCSDKDTITLRQMLSHQAGLIPYLSFWRETKKDDRFKQGLYRMEASQKFPFEVDDHLFLKEKFKRKSYRMIRRSQLLPDAEYRYSCLSFIIYPGFISEITGSDYENLLYASVYKPLGASRLVYNPLSKGFTKREMPPTEMDNYYRKSLVHGRVHDEAAAVFGGVSGNAGLFGNANDLAKLMQLYLNDGYYAGQQIIPQSVVEEFTKAHFLGNSNRRALGFDKPLLDNKSRNADKAYPAQGVSQSSYGHGGFTGTFVWMDPEHKVLYIFLSNRVYPTRDNRTLYELNVRTAIQQVLYDELNTCGNPALID